MGLCRVACVPTTGTSMLLAVSKVLFGHLVCSHIGHPLGWNPAGALPFRMRAHHRHLHAFSGFGGFDVGPSVCGGFVFDLFPAVRTGAFRADFVASKKVRFRWLPTGVLGVQRVR